MSHWNQGGEVCPQGVSALWTASAPLVGVSLSTCFNSPARTTDCREPRAIFLSLLLLNGARVATPVRARSAKPSAVSA